MNAKFLLEDMYGSGIEEFLKPEDLYALSQVSTTTRSKPLTIKFRTILDYLLKYPKLRHAPLRIISRQSGYSMVDLYEVIEFIWNSQTPIDTRSLDSIDMLYWRAEINTKESRIMAIKTLVDFKQLHVFHQQEKDNSTFREIAIKTGYDIDMIDLVIGNSYYNELVEIALTLAIFFGASIFGLVLDDLGLHGKQDHFIKIINGAYALDRGVRKAILRVDEAYFNSSNLNRIMNVTPHPNNKDGYALVGYPFNVLTRTAIKLQDVDLYIAYLKRYYNNVSEVDLRSVMDKKFNPNAETIAGLEIPGGFKP